MVEKSINLLLVFCLLFSFTTSETIPNIIEFDENGYSQYFSGSATFKIDFNHGYEYIHVKVIPDNEGKNPIVSMSSEEPECKSSRKILRMQPYDTINLFFKKGELPYSSEYLCIKFPQEGADNERYKLEIKSEDYCQLTIGEQYSYFVDEKSTRMQFKFGYEPSSLLRRLTTAFNINFWVKGQSSPNVEFLGNKFISKEFEYGQVFSGEYENGAQYILRITAEEGDYITVGSLQITDNESKELKANDLEIMGFLKRDEDEICFPIKQDDKLIGKLLRFNGNAFTKAISYFKQNGEIDSSSFKTVENGLIENLLQYDNLNTPYSFCIKHQSNIVEGRGEILFSLQMTSNSYVNLNRFIYPPQIPGMIYSHYLLKGEIAVFQGMKPKEKSIEINFNMKAIKGFPDMLFDICIDFPNCNLDPERYDYKYDPHHSNRMTTYSYFLDEENEEYKEFSPITSFQPLLIVKCIEGTNEEELSSQFCKFETSIFTDVDRMHIISGETLSQYLLENEEDLYTINIENENDLQKVYLDLIVFSGDVDLIVENDDVDPHKYYISNKIFYSIHVTNSIKIINFKVHAYKNAFYLVQHQLVKNQPGSGDINKIESGVNYIQSIFIGETASFRKNINFKNLKFDTQTPFLVSFYSQNCKYGVTREIEEVGISSIPINDNYGQLIIDKKDPYFKYDTYSFTIDIFSDDKSNYEDKLCVFYITGLELSNSNTGSERTISVSDGVSQYYIFTKDYPYIKYSYHISDLNNPVVINFNLIDKTSYIVKVAFGYEEQEPKTIYRNENIILHSSLLKELCLVRGEVCTININIELENKDNEKQTKLETTVFQVNGAPAYLEKNVMKQDILIGNKRKFYYLDIGKEDIGDITVDYKRGSGYIYAKVVTKMDTDFSSNPDWRGIYEFPNSKNGTLKYETYLKKIIINPEDTKDCDNGCYLLISIENSYYRDIPVAQENIEFLPYRITITPRIARSDSYDEVDLLPEIKMKVNEFVIGNLYPTDEKIYEYYKVTLPYDSEYLFIDWQADKSSLLINVGEEKPTKDSKHFQYNSTGYDTTFKLTKKQILGKIAPSTDTIKNVVLTLGIWNYQVDSLYTSVYAFKIFMPPTYYVNNVAEPFELIHIRSDQKVQCDPFEYSDNVYACIFAVVFDEADTNSSLIVYPKAQNENVKIAYIGALLEAEPIERNNIEYIMSKIDSLEEFKSEDSKFMYIEKIDRTKSLFFVVYAEALTNIEVLSSTYQLPNDWVIVPNPSTPQIFAIGGNRIQFNFETTKDLLINIVSLSGEGAFYWDTIEEKDIEYYLNGFEDRLTLTSTTSIDNNKKSFLVAQSNTFVQSKAEPGFVFYMTFYPRNNEYNIDQVKSGRSTEFNYREAKFPLNFYTRLTDKEVAISLTFYNFYMENGEQLQYHNNLYKIWGKIIKEEDAINARFDEYFRPINDMYAITGSVDGPFANLFFGKEDIEKFNINEDDNPTLFFSVDLGEGIDHKFKEIGVEVSILREQTDKELESFANENVYYHGKLTNIKNVSPTFRYKLKTGEMDSYMRIVFSTNSANVNWAITNDINSITNYKGLLEFENNYVNGRYIMTFKIPKLTEPYLYLIVFHDKNTIIEPKLSNYIFKYMNAKNKDDFTEFTMDSNLEVQKTERNGLKTYAISFYPIEHHDVSYYIKGIYHNSKIKGEKKDTIAISESTGYNLQIENPEFNGASKVTVYMKDIKEEIDYIKVLAKVNFNTFKEFILYYPYTINEEQEDEIIPYENIEPSTTLINVRYDSQSNLYKGKAMNAYKFQKYKLEFDNIGKVLNYINVQLNSDENLNNKIISFSPTDENGKENRIQIAQLGTEKHVNIWIKKEQLKFNYLFVTVECNIKENERCNYSMKFSGHNYGIMKSSIFNYKYYVNEKNKVMQFTISNDLEAPENYNKVLTVTATGGKAIKLKLTDALGNSFDNNNNFKTGTAIIGHISTNSPYFNLTVEAEEGNYITIGSKITIDGKSDVNVLKANGYEVNGYLERNVLEKECYLIPDPTDSEIKNSFIVAIFNTSTVISYKDTNFNEIENTVETITKGFYSYVYYHENDNNRKYICIALPNREEFSSYSLAFSLQLTQPTNKIGLANIYSPQLDGIIYPRIIPRGSYAFFSGANLNSHSEEIMYNMITTEGIPRMHMYRCTNYPLCEIDINNRTQLINVNEINRMSTWHNREKEKNNSPIDPVQYVMVAICDDIFDSKTDICQFQTSIYGNEDSVYLLEGQSFSQYIFSDHNSKYIIDFSEEKAVTKVYIDIFVVSGDVDLTLDGNDNIKINAHKYYLSNKIFYSIHINENERLKKIIVDVKAKVNTYYILEYKLIKGSESEKTNDIYSGINYLVPIPKEVGVNKKIINIHNVKILANDFFLASFYSLNCEFKIRRINRTGEAESITSFVNYGQDIINEDENKDIDIHSYQITVVDTDTSEYEHNMCMLYVSGLEITHKKHSIYQKEILISEGIPQRTVFMDLKKIKYIYPNPDKEKNVAIYFKVINPARYSYTITFNHNEKQEKYFYQSNIEYFEQSQINKNCGTYDLCTIVLSIEVIEEFEDYTPILEVSIRQIDNIPYYISKGLVKQDFVPAKSWLNLFTTLGKDDQGYINVDFARGSGLIYAKIVPINGEGDKNPEWRQYKFPRTIEETLKYDFYNKKLLFNKAETNNCDDGCYLLISLQSSAIGHLDQQFRFHQFSITVNLIPRESSKKAGPLIQIEPEEYIIGSLDDPDRITKKDMYEFYQINIPYDADKVEFDWQSDSAILLLNVGEIRPTIDNANFKKVARSDTVFEITREEILKELVAGNYIKNAFLTIGVYTENLETSYGTSYSFRVHFSKNLNIYKVNSDQKTLCKPDSIGNNEYRCLFMITYGELDFIYDLMIYSKSQSSSATTYMYGDFIQKEIYDRFDIHNLTDIIPNEEKSAYNTKSEKIDFIFLTLSDPNSHFYISVISDQPDIIEFISSFKTFDTELSPNPSSAQLYSIKNYPSLKLKFLTTKPLIINLVSLYGESNIYLEDELNAKYTIRGRDDRLSLAIPSNNIGKEAILIVENKKYGQENNESFLETTTMEMPDVAFYLEYYLRSKEMNLDEIYLGKTSEIAYKSSDFPLNYYSKLNDLKKDIIIFFNFHDLKLTDSKMETRKIESNEFNFKLTIIPQQDIYLIKTGNISSPNNNVATDSILYDPALLAGQLSLTSDQLKKYENLSDPTLYLSFEKQKSEIDYNKIRLELTAIQKNSDIPVTEKLYQYGQILDKKDIHYYKLKVDNSNGYMRIQFSANSKNINFTISNEKEIRLNTSYSELTTKVERGKVFVTFKKPDKEFIYLNVFLNDNAEKISKLNNYVFKYINSLKLEDFFEYPILNNNASIQVNIRTEKINKNNVNNLNVEFNKIDRDNTEIIYSLKVAKKWEHSKDELNNTIALSNSPYYVTQISNQKNNKISMNMNDIGEKNTYIEVIAQIKDGPIIEYVAYDPYYLDENDRQKNNNNKDDDTKTLIWVIVGIGGGLFIILLVLVIVFVMNNRRSKDLLEEVNKISFAQEEEKENGDNLLLDNSNELN